MRSICNTVLSSFILLRVALATLKGISLSEEDYSPAMDDLSTTDFQKVYNSANGSEIKMPAFLEFLNQCVDKNNAQSEGEDGSSNLTPEKQEQVYLRCISLFNQKGRHNRP
ncbi:hypothetical protein JCM33374_g5994 [Metschnikowia sp. JCM 33374]|nr:hypothetical protein JCM33374_g5994 [Metschnikowia sp. JCM 33374]